MKATTARITALEREAAFVSNFTHHRCKAPDMFAALLCQRNIHTANLQVFLILVEVSNRIWRHLHRKKKLI